MRIRRRPATENVGFNMTPMIDIVFQLITFFMLATDMSQRELERVHLPDAPHAEPEKGGEADRIFINVHHDPGVACPDYDPSASGEAIPVCRAERHWKLSVRGEEMTLERLFHFLELESQRRTDPTDPKVSLRTVEIRADRGAPYEVVYQVGKTCERVGIYRTEFGATVPLGR